MSLLEVRDLSVSFGGVKALDNVSMSVKAGEIFSVIGPNGAGKTTLLNTISGLYVPDSGAIALSGVDISGLLPHERARVGLQRSFQNLQLFSGMTALENVAVGAHLRQRSGFLAGLLGLPSVRTETKQINEQARALMTQYKLDEFSGYRAGDLPYGLQKRLEIVRAIAANPRVLLLDEPAAGLNAIESTELAGFIRQVVSKGVTVVLVEHDMELVMDISDRILVLDFGKPLARGTPSEVAANPEVISAYLGVSADVEA